MLKRLQSAMAVHILAATNSFQTLYRSPFSSIMTMLVMSVVLTFPILFLVFSNNITKLTTDWQKDAHVVLYLKTSLNPEEEQNFLKKVRSMDAVLSATYKSKDQGLAEMQNQEGMKDIMHYLPDNPLPAVIEVAPKDSIKTAEQMLAFLAGFKAMPQVDQAKMDVEWMNRLQSILSFINKIADSVALFLFFSVIFIVGNTLRLAIVNREEEIQILKLIGATNAFIRRPFLYLGTWFGLFAAIFAVLFVNVFMYGLLWVFQDVLSLYHKHVPIFGLTVQQAYLIVLVSVFLGWLGARLSIDWSLYRSV